MQAHKIKNVLSRRHTKDYFMTEPLCGSAGSQRFDAYAITKSWAHLKYTGYEIKVSRSDFLQDEKWRGYLPFCNEFYWVCPKDLIKKEEIADDCGLIYVYPETMAMRKVVRAKFREIEHPVEILLHALFWREQSIPYLFFNNKAEYFKTWLKNKELNNDLGHNVSNAMREEIRKVERLKYQHETAYKKAEKFEQIEKLLIQNNLRPYYRFEETLQELDNRLKGSIPKNIIEKLESAKTNLENALGSLAVAVNEK